MLRTCVDTLSSFCEDLLPVLRINPGYNFVTKDKQYNFVTIVIPDVMSGQHINIVHIHKLVILRA